MWPFMRKKEGSSGFVQDPDILYVIVEDGKAIKCGTCGMTSWHPKDVEYRYCGNCHKFHEDGPHPRRGP